MPGSGTMTPAPVPVTPTTTVTSPCTQRYASADEYAAFWCVSGVMTGYDDGGAAPHPALSDADAEFQNRGIEVGMIIYNLTAGTSGAVTAVSQSTLTASGVTWSNGDRWWIVPLTLSERATIENYLDITANDIHIALAAVGACDCTLASRAIAYLAKLNIVEAAAFHKCTCAQPHLDDDARQALLTWATQQLELIRTMKLELCDGYTGADYPAFGWPEQALTERGAAEIIANDLDRSGEVV